MSNKKTAIMAVTATLIITGLSLASLHNQTKLQQNIEKLQAEVTAQKAKNNELYAGIEKTNAETKSSIEKMQAINNDYAHALQDFKQEVAVINQKEQHAEKAWLKSQEARKANDTESALLYGVNAASTNPSRVDYYLNLAEIASMFADRDSSRLEEILAILDMGMYRISVDQLDALKEQSDKLRMRIAAIRENKLKEATKIQEEAEQRRLKELANQWAQLETPGDYQKQIHICRQRLANLQQEPESDEYRKTATILTILQSVKNIDSNLNRIEQMLDSPSQITDDILKDINNSLQVADAAIVSLKALEMSDIPAGYADKVKELGQRLAANEQKTAEKKSADLKQIFDAVDNDNLPAELTTEWKCILDTVDNSFPLEGGSNTQEILKLKRKIAKLNALIAAMPSMEAQKIARKKITYRSNELLNLEKKRLAEYQSWAVDICKEAIKYYEDNTFGDAQANHIVYKMNFSSIEAALLSPEAMEIYQYIRSKIVSEYDNGKTAAEAMKKIATCKKKTLNDF